MQNDDQTQQTAIADEGGDSFSETSYTSWWDRIKTSLGGLLFGLALIGGSIPGIFWNEGRAVNTQRALDEGAGLSVTVPADKIDRANDGKLVHVTGTAKAGGQVRDPDIGLSANGVRLVRHVEMFQWKEHKKSESRSKLGGGQETVTTYEYRREWAKDRAESSSFREQRGHENPQMRYHGKSFAAPDVKLGAFALSEPIVSRLGEGKELTPPATLEVALRNRYGAAQIADGKIHIGESVSAPRAGDLKIWYTAVADGPVSVAARQQAEGFAEFKASNGRSFLLVRNGEHSSAELFDSAKEDNRFLAWILRAAGTLAMFIGWSLLMRPVVVLADVVPIFGSIAGFGAGLIAAVLTLIFAPLTMAVAWLYYRPLVSLGIAAAGIAAAFGLKQMRGRQVPRAMTALPNPNQVPVQAASFSAAPRSPFLPPRK